MSSTGWNHACKWKLQGEEGYWCHDSPNLDFDSMLRFKVTIFSTDDYASIRLVTHYFHTVNHTSNMMSLLGTFAIRSDKVKSLRYAPECTIKSVSNSNADKQRKRSRDQSREIQDTKTQCQQSFLLNDFGYKLWVWWSLMRFTPANGNYSHILCLGDILNSTCTLVVESVSWNFTKNYIVI